MSENSKSENKKSGAMSTFQELSKQTRKLMKKAHSTLGIFGWISIVLVLLLLGTIVHFEQQMYRFGYVQSYQGGFHSARMMNDTWNREVNADFARMQEQMNEIRNTHEKAFKEITTPTVTATTGQASTTTNFVSTDTKQYSVNTNNGKLDGFASYTNPEQTTALIPELKKLGLTVEQKDTKLFFTGTGDKLNAVLASLEK